MWNPEDCARDEGWHDGFKDGLKEAVKIVLGHNCNHSCADRGAGVTCSWEIAENIKARAKSIETNMCKCTKDIEVINESLDADQSLCGFCDKPKEKVA